MRRKTENQLCWLGKHGEQSLQKESFLLCVWSGGETIFQILSNCSQEGITSIVISSPKVLAFLCLRCPFHGPQAGVRDDRGRRGLKRQAKLLDLPGTALLPWASPPLPAHSDSPTDFYHFLGDTKNECQDLCSLDGKAQVLRNYAIGCK